MSAFTITPCNAGDVQALAAVAVKSYLETYRYLWNDDGEWYINRCFAEPVLANDLRQPDQEWFLMKENEVVVGYLKLNPNHPLEDYETYDSFELERIYLVNDVQGKGYGRKAVEFCEQYARKLNKDIIWLKAMDSINAPAFYEKLGYKICGTYLLDFELMKVELRGMVVMLKWLNQPAKS